MGTTSDANGDITFDIIIPDDTLAIGIHDLDIELSNGKKYHTKYINSPVVSPSLLRQVTSTIKDGTFGPVAQTFTLPESRDVAAVSICVNKGTGTDDVIVQLRTVGPGSIPTDIVLAESRVKAVDLQPFSSFTRFDFNALTPVKAGVEYCFVIFSKDVNYTVAVAELGKPDSVTGAIIAAQPAAGVLLTSSNGAAWTIEQNKDLKFKLHAASYSATSRVVSLGTVSGTNISDIMVTAVEELSEPETKITYTVTLPDSSTVTLDNLSSLNLNGYKSGNFSVSANLSGTSKRSPILFPNTRLEMGTIALSATRYSTRFYVPDSFTYRVKIEARIKGNGTFGVAIESGSADNYLAMTQIAAEPLPDGFIALTFERTGCTEVGTLNLSSIRLTPSLPTAADRVDLRRLRGWAI